MIEDGFPIIKESEWKAVPGMMAGALELIRPDTSKAGSGLKAYWLCKCHNCNRPDLVSKRLDNLKIGAIGGKVYATGRKCNGTRSCGCKQKTQFVNANTTGIIYEDLTGQIFGKLKVIELDEENHRVKLSYKQLHKTRGVKCRVPEYEVGYKPIAEKLPSWIDEYKNDKKD